MVRDGLVFKDEDGQVIFNQYSFCELVKYLLVELVGISYEEASQIVERSPLAAPVYPYIGGKTPQLTTCIRNCPGFHLWIKTHPCKGKPLVLSVFQMLFQDS